jgi:hypothetical protein
MVEWSEDQEESAKESEEQQRCNFNKNRVGAAWQCRLPKCRLSKCRLKNDDVDFIWLGDNQIGSIRLG